MNEQQIREKIDQYSRFKHHGRLNIIDDTSQFMSINADDVLELAGKYYLVRGDETEVRFGLEGEPKFWVKRGIDLSDGSSKIVKLVFHESFHTSIGGYRIKCFRSPQKEGRILEKVDSYPDFMHGITVYDRAQNTIRVVDRIQGTSFFNFIHELEVNHETYFEHHFPQIFKNVLRCLKAIGRLHRMGELHGDIRTDHVLIERGTGLYRWIDFDYTYEWTENPYGVDLLGLGNILLFAIGKGFYHLKDLTRCGPEGAAVLASLEEDDMSLYSPNRIINLRKLFPYIPECLNYVLLHFAQGAEVSYESTEEFLEDLEMCRHELCPVSAQV